MFISLLLRRDELGIYDEVEEEPKEWVKELKDEMEGWC
jgi:hypothetical protein